MIRRTDFVFKILGLVFLPLGGVFLILSAVFAIVLANGGGTTLSPDDATAFTVLVFVFLGIGLIFAILGLIFFLIWRRNEAKAARLKRDGVCYDAEITAVRPSLTVNYGRYGYYGNPSCVVECWYRDQQGKTCLVKSGGLLINPLFFGAKKDELTAKVYVSRDDPTDYYVEVTAGSASNMKFDNDYR